MAAQSPLLTCCHCSPLQGRSPDLHGKGYTHTRKVYTSIATSDQIGLQARTSPDSYKGVPFYRAQSRLLWHLADCQQQSMK